MKTNTKSPNGTSGFSSNGASTNLNSLKEDIVAQIKGLEDAVKHLLGKGFPALPSDLPEDTSRLNRIKEVLKGALNQHLKKAEINFNTCTALYDDAVIALNRIESQQPTDDEVRQVQLLNQMNFQRIALGLREIIRLSEDWARFSELHRLQPVLESILHQKIIQAVDNDIQLSFADLRAKIEDLSKFSDPPISKKPGNPNAPHLVAIREEAQRLIDQYNRK